MFRSRLLLISLIPALFAAGCAAVSKSVDPVPNSTPVITTPNAVVEVTANAADKAAIIALAQLYKIAPPRPTEQINVLYRQDLSSADAEGYLAYSQPEEIATSNGYLRFHKIRYLSPADTPILSSANIDLYNPKIEQYEHSAIAVANISIDYHFILSSHRVTSNIIVNESTLLIPLHDTVTITGTGTLIDSDKQLTLSPISIGEEVFSTINYTKGKTPTGIRSRKLNARTETFSFNYKGTIYTGAFCFNTTVTDAETLIITADIYRDGKRIGRIGYKKFMIPVLYDGDLNIFQP